MGSNCSKITSPTTSTITSPTTSIITSPTTLPTTTPVKFSTFEDRILQFHNKARVQNGLNPLVWDKALQQKANEWGKVYIGENGGTCDPVGMRHPGTGIPSLSVFPESNEIERFLPNNWGQNLSIKAEATYNMKPDGQWVASSYVTDSPEHAVGAWYDECKDYNPDNINSSGIPSNFLKVGHFTQLLWKDTTKVGCSDVPCNNTYTKLGITTPGSTIVCNYDKGNIGGQFGEKVPKNPICSPPNGWIFQE